MEALNIVTTEEKL